MMESQTYRTDLKQKLRFAGNGRFVILQFTDVHWKNHDEKDEQSYGLMKRIAEWEKPDLVVFTGDTIFSKDCTDPEASLRQATRVPEEMGIPWALVFGNHDTEKNCTRTQLMASIVGSAYGTSEAGPEYLSGVGNYTLDILDRHGTETAARLYFLDSGDYAAPEIGGYGWIKPDQIAWYGEQSRLLAATGKQTVPGLAFFHIPLPEQDELWRTQTVRGTKTETVCCAKVNSGFFAAMLERQDIMAAFVGHDHLNDYGGRLHGIGLYYGRATGYNTYGFQERGARIIRLQEGARTFETWIRLDSGKLLREEDQPRHTPDRAEGGDSV